MEKQQEFSDYIDKITQGFQDRSKSSNQPSGSNPAINVQKALEFFNLGRGYKEYVDEIVSNRVLNPTLS